MAILKAYPEWDFVCTDFLRAPASGRYPAKHIIHHLGERTLVDPEFKKKTIYQILATERTFHIETLETIMECGIQWVDLNFGCPSKTVNTHGGGAVLLQDLPILEKIVRDIRRTFTGTLTVKTRVGFRDDKNFPDIIKLFCNEGVEAITIHARTRDQLYHGIADWKYIEQAVGLSTVPIIGNGDVWKPSDIEKIFSQTGCHSVMIGRGSLKTPWLARLHKEQKEDELALRLEQIQHFYGRIAQEFMAAGYPEPSALKRMKSICRFIFEDIPQGAIFKRKLLFSQQFNDFNRLISNLPASLEENFALS